MTGDLKNENLFKNMFNASVEGILVLNKNGIILMANPACKSLFGYNPDDLIGKSIEILIAEKHRQALKKQLLNFQKTTCCKPLDILGIKKDNSQFNFEIRLNSTEINDNNEAIAFLRDTSNTSKNLLKIKQTDKALFESNRKFDALINNLQGIVYRCKNDRDWTMEYISDGCQKITGYSAEAFLDGTVHFSHITFQEDQDQIWNDTQKAIQNKKHFYLNFRIKDKKGTIKYLQEIGQGVFDKNGNLEAIEGFITDVTVQKELELSLKANQAKTKALLEAIPDMMFIQDYNGNYLDCFSNSPQKVLWPLENCIGANMKDVLPASVYKKVKKSHKNVIASGALQIVEYSVKGKKGIEHYEMRVVLMNNYSLLTIVRNVTEKKARDTELNIKDNALASASNSIIIANAEKPDVPIIYCNTAFEKITGYKKEEVYGKNCNFLQDDDRDQKEIDVMKNAIAKGEACNVVLRNYKKDGTLFWNDVSITPVRNHENKLTHFVGVQNDVTNKIMAENLKDRTQNILELIAKDKPLKIIIKEIIDIAEVHLNDCIGSVSLLNKVDKTLNLLAAPNLPKAFRNFINDTAIGPKVGSCCTAAFLKKEVVVSNIETNILWEDYKAIALKNGLKACWAFPIMSSTNKVLGTFSIYSLLVRQPLANEKEILLDLTYLASIAIEKHNNRIVLEESNKQLELYAQKLEEKVQERTKEVMATVKELVAVNLNLEDQILVTKQAEGEAITRKALAAEVARNFPKGFIAVMNKDSQLVLAEGEALDELGLRPLIFEGMTLEDVSVFAQERKTRLKADISKTLSGQHLSFEIEYKNRYFAVNTAPLFDENNQIIYALMVYNDISEQKETEFSIQNALKKEKELNELKSRFVSMASHEFRTPLSAILTSAILIGKQNESGKTAKREKYILKIEKNVNHLVTILNDFLSLSKLEEGKIGSVKEHFDIIYFSKNIINEIKVSLKKGQHIGFINPMENLFVNLDTKLLRHIIINLLSNASKYSEENTNIDFKITENHSNVLIEITDQGIGVSEEEQKHLFDRFFRAKNANNIEGTGLGLNIAKHYTELMGGKIGCKSKLNVGTTIWVELPLEKKE